MKTSAFWSFVYGLFFIFLVFLGLMWIHASRFTFIFIPLEELFVMSLAVFRLTRLTTYDLVTKFIRDAVGKARPDTFVGTFSQLLNCPWCTGLWWALIIVFAYYMTPLSWPVILVLAVAGVASILQIFSNLLGWHAEGKKRSVLGMDDNGSKSSCG